LLLQQVSGALQVELLNKAGVAVVGLRHQEAHVEVAGPNAQEAWAS
jgi:hypothetical protein